MKLLPVLVCAVSLWSGCSKKAAPAPQNAEWKAIDELEISKLTIAKGTWEVEFNAETHSWPMRKPGKGPWIFDGNLVYLQMPRFDSPHTPEPFAEKLKELDWSDLSSQWIEVTRTTRLPHDGFVIEGKAITTIRGTASPPLLAFAMILDVGGRKAACQSVQLTSEADRAEAIALCQSAK